MMAPEAESEELSAGSMNPKPSKRNSLWIAWGAAAVLALLAACLALELELTREQVSNLETLNRITESQLRDAENHREAERILNRAMLEAAKK